MFFVIDICSSSSCQHLCVADHNADNYTCHCSIGFQLQPDNKSCAASVLYDEFALVVDKRLSKLFQVSIIQPQWLNLDLEKHLLEISVH